MDLKQNLFFSLFACLKIKSIIWRETKWKKINFSLVQIKISFAHFWRRKKIKIKQILVSNFIFVDCSFMYKEGFCKTKYIFIWRSLWCFKKWKLCRACAARARPNSPIFWNWTFKNMPDRQHIVPVFKHRKKYYITPPYWASCPSGASLQPHDCSLLEMFWRISLYIYD